MLFPPEMAANSLTQILAKNRFLAKMTVPKPAVAQIKDIGQRPGIAQILHNEILGYSHDTDRTNTIHYTSKIKQNTIEMCDTSEAGDPKICINTPVIHLVIQNNFSMKSSRYVQKTRDVSAWYIQKIPK